MLSNGGVIEFPVRSASRTDRRVLSGLNGRMREFIGRQEMVFIAFAGDSIMRAGPAGFIGSLGRRHLFVPDLPVEPQVSLLFVDFFDDVNALHLLGRCTVAGRFEVTSAYFD